MSAAPAPDELRVVPLPDLEQLRERWGELTEVNGNPFLSWEWASTWWHHFGRGREQKILGATDSGGRLVAIVPLYFDTTRRLKVLRFVGHFPADQLGPVCAPERAAEVMRCLRSQLFGERCWDLLLLERLPSDLDLGPQLDARPIRAEISPELDIETTDWDEFLASRSKHFRGRVRNGERRLQRDHSLRYRRTDSAEDLSGDMDILFKLHDLRYSSEPGGGAFSEEIASFHRDFARQALERGWLRLWVAYLDEEPAAAWYGFRLGEADWFYQSGRNPAYDRQSVGFVLIANTLRDAVASGIRTYKLLLGDEDYKKRYSSRESTVETYALTRTLRGRLALRAVMARNALRARRRPS